MDGEIPQVFGETWAWLRTSKLLKTVEAITMAGSTASFGKSWPRAARVKE